MNLYCFKNCLSQYFLFDKAGSPSDPVLFTCLSSLVAECYHNGVHQEPWKALFGKKGAAAETPEQGSSDKKNKNRQEKQPRKKLDGNRGHTDSSSSESDRPVLDLKRLRASSRPPPSSQPPKTAGTLSVKEYSQRAPVDDQLRASLSMAKTSVEGGQDQTEAYLWRKKITQDKLWPRQHGSDAFRCVSFLNRIPCFVVCNVL